VRAVLDPNVLVSAAISPTGPPRQIISAWVEGRFELVASPQLLSETRDVLARPKFRRWISEAVAAEIIDGIAQDATILDDPPIPERFSSDPDDDYLIALARAAQADWLVSGDRDLLELADPDPPVLTPREFLELLDAWRVLGSAQGREVGGGVETLDR
jgi:putative PIN family toxin of toxin-antitoxin system